MQTQSRLSSIDVLRGAVMLLMALDHARDFFHDSRTVPEELAQPGAALFLTRWLTHFCAPAFVLLAGVSIWLWQARGRTRAETSRYLLSRGFWLLLLEWSVVHFAWFFQFSGFFVLQVIAAIGAAMLVMAALVHLPRSAVFALGLLIVLAHNGLDRFDAMDAYQGRSAWYLLHQKGLVPLTSRIVFWVQYPLLPWIGVMALGYGAGPVFSWPAERRRRWLIALGISITLAFVLLRATSDYGDPVPWAQQANGEAAWMRFLNCQKYPPSLDFLAMTLGPALLFLGLIEHGAGRLGAWLRVFGRVPLFYYVAHLYLLHAAADLARWMRGEPRVDPLRGVFPEESAPWALWVTYLAWVSAVLLLYRPCRWYADFKRARRSSLWTYL